jgi:hypothetical protein
MENGETAPYILNVGTRRTRLVSFTPRSLCSLCLTAMPNKLSQLLLNRHNKLCNWNTCQQKWNFGERSNAGENILWSAYVTNKLLVSNLSINRLTL